MWMLKNLLLICSSQSKQFLDFYATNLVLESHVVNVVQKKM